MVSSEQVDAAQYIYKWPTMLSKLEGSTNVNMGNLYTTRLYKTQLAWRQYVDTENELLLEAVALARMTRQQTSNPALEAPR